MLLINIYDSRAKPRDSAAGDNKKQSTGSSTQQTTITKKAYTSAPDSTSAKPSASTSPKRPPPKNIEKVIHQSLKRKILGPQRILKPITVISKKSTIQKWAKKTTNLRTTSQRGKGSPEKMPRRDNAQIHFECKYSSHCHLTIRNYKGKHHRHKSRRPNGWTENARRKTFHQIADAPHDQKLVPSQTNSELQSRLIKSSTTSRTPTTMYAA